MKHIQTFESFLSESAKPWKVAYAGKGFYGVTNGGKIEGEMSKEDAEKEAKKRNSAKESIVNEAQSTSLTVTDFDEYVNPDYVKVTLSDGRKLEIKRKNIKGGQKMYQTILQALDSYKSNPKAKTFMDNLVNAMAINDNSQRPLWII